MKKITKVFGVALFAISMMVTGCSNPGDNDGDKSSPAPSEQPANPDNPGDTEDTVTFETLGVEDYAESQRIIEIGFPRAKATIPIMIRKN